MMDCKKALAEAGGDMDKAIEILRVKGQAQAAKRGERAASEGWSELYPRERQDRRAHGVDCETDFVAKNDDFKDFAREVALHVAAAAPLYVSEERSRGGP